MKEKLRRNNFLRNKKSFIFLLILCLGVGFAFLSTQLNITGNTSVSGNKWSVYFDNIQITEGSVDASVVPTTTGTTTTSVNYTVLLDKPGDFYEFTVDAVNAGTINAMIESINMSSLDSDLEKYLSYTVTYVDGNEVAQNDILKKKSTATYKVRVEFKKDISASDLDEEGANLTLTFGVNYVQSTIKAVASEFVKLVKSNALKDNSIDFTLISSDTNGKGLYLRSGTESEDYPIYYYRGNVSNNNAKFAGFCWKIVRTTETGGTKLIYNGKPNASGGCTNTTGSATQLASSSKFNPNFNSPAYVGYMYGKLYTYSTKTTNTSYVYGNTFTYSDGNYTLSNTHNGLDDTHHYTCFDSTGVCSSIFYVYYLDGTTAYYLTLTEGKSVEDAVREMNTNTTSSTVKTAVDNWFNNTFKTYFTNRSKDYNDYLEDTIWCNDRSYREDESIYSYEKTGWNPNGGSASTALRYSAIGRMGRGAPSLTCPNKNDSFTVTESATGNGALTYPVGLLTSDEMNLAGSQLWQSENPNNKLYYLYTDVYWWTMSPSWLYRSAANIIAVSSLGIVDHWTTYYTTDALAVRPSISIKPNVKIADGGDGTSTKPYEFVVE